MEGGFQTEQQHETTPASWPYLCTTLNLAASNSETARHLGRASLSKGGDLREPIALRREASSTNPAEYRYSPWTMGVFSREKRSTARRPQRKLPRGPPPNEVDEPPPPISETPCPVALPKQAGNAPRSRPPHRQEFPGNQHIARLPHPSTRAKPDSSNSRADGKVERCIGLKERNVLEPPRRRGKSIPSLSPPDASDPPRRRFSPNGASGFKRRTSRPNQLNAVGILRSCTKFQVRRTPKLLRVL